MGDVINLFRGRRLCEAVAIAKLSRKIWQARMAGEDTTNLIELRHIHKAAHGKFLAAEIREMSK